MLFTADRTDEMTDFTTSDGWLRIARDLSTAKSDATLDAPGLWKRSGTLLLFEAPLAAIVRRIDDLDTDGDPEVEIASMLASWAMETIDGGVPEAWTPPPRERLDELAPAAVMSLRSGSFIEPVRLIADERTLRVQVGLGRLDTTLRPTRRRWVDELIAATERLRMVRVGLRDDGDRGGSIEAAVDLTGAPVAIAEALLPAALDALRHCFVYFVPTATLIGDAGCASRVLDAASSRNTPCTRSRKK